MTPDTERGATSMQDHHERDPSHDAPVTTGRDPVAAPERRRIGHSAGALSRRVGAEQA